MGTDTGLAKLVRGCPKLLPDQISLCKKLAVKRGDKYLEAVAAVHPELTHIDLRGCTAVTEAGLAKLVRGCPKLLPDQTYLLCNRLAFKKGDKYLEAVAAVHPELTHIDLR